jgi:RNA polymerase sigma-70 factor, ECF subfamily
MCLIMRSEQLLYKMPRTQTMTDRERVLIEAFTQGEMAGFKYVYTRFRQRVLSYCLYYMGDRMLAEDAFQEVFSRVYTRRAQLRDPKALKSWVLLITRSVCLNLLRSSKFTPEFVSIGAENFESFGSTIDTPSEPIEHVIADDMLRVALSKIAPIYREAFLLREFEGYDYEEIARITQATEMNVKVRITRAKKQLRILLAPVYKYEASQANLKSRPGRQEKVSRIIEIEEEVSV